MNANHLNFNLHAMASPQSRQDCIALAKEILADLEIISNHFDQAIARCETAVIA